MSGSIGGLLNLIDQQQQGQGQNQVQQPAVQGLLGGAPQILPTDPFAAKRAADAAAAAAQGPAAGTPGGPQAPAISPMWGSWGGFGGTPSNYSSTNLNPFAGAVPADPNPGHMTFAQAQAQAQLPGQNPFPLFEPDHPMWQLMFNQYTDGGRTDPRLLFQGGGGGRGGGGGEGGTGGGAGGPSQGGPDVSSGPGTW